MKRNKGKGGYAIIDLERKPVYVDMDADQNTLKEHYDLLKKLYELKKPLLLTNLPISTSDTVETDTSVAHGEVFKMTRASNNIVYGIHYVYVNGSGDWESATEGVTLMDGEYLPYVI